jgi:Domain of unknown function (DUF4234)
MTEVVQFDGTSAAAKIRHPLAAFGLVFLTLGIYYFVWYYKVNRELRDLGRATGDERRLGTSPLTSLLAVTVGWLIVVPPFVSLYRTFQRIEGAQEVTRTSRRVNVWLGFSLYLIGLFTLPVEIIYAQSELNHIWRGKTAQTPAPATVAAS